MFRKTKKNKLQSILTVLIVIILFLGLQLNNRINTHIKNISYNEFMTMVDKKDINQVLINFNSNKFKAYDKKNNLYSIPNPKYADFKKDLLLKDVDVHVLSFSFLDLFFKVLGIVIPTILMFYLFDKYLKKNLPGDKSNSFGFVNFEVPNIKFSDISGNKEVKEEMKQIVDFLKNPKKYTDRGVNFPKGIIFFGPPGTGKTLTAKAIAGECEVPFLNVSGSDFIEMYSGVGAKRVRDLFKLARAKAPCIIFIDEIDSIGTKRGLGSNENERTQTINALLAEMDGFKNSSGVLVISATNRLEDLDNALTRAGRFDKHIKIPLPESYERLEMLNNYIKDKKISKDISIENLAKETIGFSGADICNLINEANFISVTKNKKEIDRDDLDDAYFKILMKGHKKPLSKNKDDINLVAWHETGHALANILLEQGDEINKVTIIPSSSGAGGVTMTMPSENISLHSKAYIETRIKVLYAGRIGEYLLLKNEDDITTGASQDIKEATNLIKGYISQFGMNDKYGMLNLSTLNINDDIIVEESVKLSKKLYNEMFKLLKKNIDLFNIITKELIVKETLTGEELIDIVNRYYSKKGLKQFLNYNNKLNC